MSNKFQICFCGEIAEESEESEKSVEWYVIEVPVRDARLPEETKELNRFSVGNYFPSVYYAALGDRIYSLGGQRRSEGGGETLLNDVWFLDRSRSEDGWKPGPPMNNLRCSPHTMVVDGKLYVLGGFQPNQKKTVGWIEIFDPNVGVWESLLSPPDQIHSSLMISGFLEAKNEIIIAKQHWKSHPEFYSFNVMNRSWNTLPERGPSVHPRVERAVSGHPNIGRAVSVGNTLYWISTDEERNYECIISAFDLDKNMWFEDSLNTATIFGKREHFSSIYSSGPGFLHLRDEQFCLILQSTETKDDPPSSIEYLYCVVLEIFPIYEEGHEYKGKLELKILFIRKYSMNHYIGFLDCMLVVAPKQRTPLHRLLKTFIGFYLKLLHYMRRVKSTRASKS